MVRRQEAQRRARAARDREYFVQYEQRNQPPRRKPHKSLGLYPVRSGRSNESRDPRARDYGVYENNSNEHDRKVPEYQIHADHMSVDILTLGMQRESVLRAFRQSLGDCNDRYTAS